MFSLFRPSIIFVVLVVPIIFTSHALASTYYVDATTGNDTDSGLTPDHAWQTLERLTESSFSPGDSILLKRGEIWRTFFHLNTSGNLNAPVVLSAYGKGEKPVISGRDTLRGWDDPDTWKAWGVDVWRTSCSGDPQRLWVNGEEILHTDTVDRIDGGEHQWTYHDGYMYVHATGNPALVFQSMQTRITYHTVLVKRQHHLIIEDIEIRGGSGGALTFLGCHHIQVRNCTLGWGSRMGILIQGEDRVSSHDIVIDNNRIDSGFRATYGSPSYRGVEDGILIKQAAYDCVVKNNVVADWGHCGIYLYALYEGDSGVYNNRIYNNEITGEHVSYMHGIGTDGREGLCHHNVFYNNLIRDITVRNQVNGNHNWVHHNIIRDMTNSPVTSAGTAQGLDMQGYGEDLVCHDNRYDNNLIMNCDEAGIRLRGGPNDKTNNVFRNNLIVDCGRASNEGLDHCGIVIDNSESIYANTFRNNCITGPSERVVYYRYFYLTADEFNDRDGQNGNVLADNIQASPEFADVANHDYHLTASSPCIDAGIDVGLTSDFDGNPIPMGSAPDIGLYEWQGSTAVRDWIGRLPESYQLSPAYPNPFNSGTTFTIAVSREKDCTVNIYDVTGRLVRTLVEDQLSAGTHSLRWQGTDARGMTASSGLYVIVLEAEGVWRHRKVVMVR